MQQLRLSKQERTTEQTNLNISPFTSYLISNLMPIWTFIDEITVSLMIYSENFSFLNYLEQGQNQLLQTRVDERKDALGSLFNIIDIAAEIENCRLVANKLTKYISDATRKERENSLEAEYTALREMAQADVGVIEYKMY